MFHFVLGGARSGKSRFAETLAHDSGLSVSYLATAKSLDKGMAERIKRHKNDRPDHWTTIEEPVQLAQQIIRLRGENHFVLIDCLTLWLMNLIDEQQDITQNIDQLLAAIGSTEGPIVMVSNEISMGVVPMGKLTRDYVDELGRMHQAIAQTADKVTLMVAGLPVTVK